MLQQKEYDISTLVTIINKDYNRVSMYGLRVSLLEKQAKSLNITLHKIEFPAEVSMSLYDEIMQTEVHKLKNSGYTHCCFGDISFKDLKAYRENQLQTVGIHDVFTIWKTDPKCC